MNHKHTSGYWAVWAVVVLGVLIFLALASSGCSPGVTRPLPQSDWYVITVPVRPSSPEVQDGQSAAPEK